MNLPRTTPLGRPLASPHGYYSLSIDEPRAGEALLVFLMSRMTKTHRERRGWGGRWLCPRAVSLPVSPMLAKRFG